MTPEARPARGAETPAATPAEPGALTDRPWRVAACLAAIMTLALAVFSPMLGYHGLEPHNLITFSTAYLSNPSEVFTGAYLPGDPSYRPLAKLYYLAQNLLFGCVAGRYYLANLLLIALMVGVVYLLALGQSRSHLAALLLCGIILTDPRLGQFKWPTAAHNFWACLSGYLALYLVWTGDQAGRAAWPRRAAVFLLLLAAPLFKEYGLAFAPAAFLAAFCWKRPGARWTIAAATLAVLAYFLMRQFLAGGATEGFQTVYGPKSLRLFVDNVWLSLLSTVMGSVVRYDRVINWWGYWSVLDFLALPLAAWALRKDWRLNLPLLGLIAANALLNFFSFQPRNQLAGLAAYYLICANGLAWLWRGLPDGRRKAAVWCSVAILAFFTAKAGLDLNRYLAEIAARPPDWKIVDAASRRAGVSPQAVECAKRQYDSAR